MDQAEVEMLGKNTLADYKSYSVKETHLAAKKLPIKADQQRAGTDGVKAMGLICTPFHFLSFNRHAKIKAQLEQ